MVNNFLTVGWRIHATLWDICEHGALAHLPRGGIYHKTMYAPPRKPRKRMSRRDQL